MLGHVALETAGRLLSDFAERTGLRGPPSLARRYLWTDAFAVRGFLELHRRTGERAPLESALALVEQVHATLGRHRPDDPRSGWISGLPEPEGGAHPTRGGLRIGKPLPERRAGEPLDEQLEWERDGQYFHYLTKWMGALADTARVADDVRLLRLSLELAVAAHRGFVRRPPGGGRPRMAWKLSVDLSRPLVPSTGHHDPLDGLLTFRELAADARAAGLADEATALDVPVGDMAAMCAGVDWTTADPLGLGGLLSDAWRTWRLMRCAPAPQDGELLQSLLHGCARGLPAWVRAGELAASASRRLAFRELGLALGLHALPLLLEREQRAADQEILVRLRPAAQLAGAIEAFWLDPAHQATEAWRSHLDINAVMLAASLLPESVLGTS